MYMCNTNITIHHIPFSNPLIKKDITIFKSHLLVCQIVHFPQQILKKIPFLGDPKPTVAWSRKDGFAVIDGKYKRG